MPGRHAKQVASRRRPRTFLIAGTAAVLATAAPVAVALAAHDSSSTVVAVDTSSAQTLAPAAPAAAVPSPATPRKHVQRAMPDPKVNREAARETPLSRSMARTMVSGHGLPGVTESASPTSTPDPTPSTGGLSDAPCPDGSVEKGLAADTIRVYRAVCHAFPQVTHYLGWGPRSEHDTGHAIDVMVYGDRSLGDEIAAWAQAHASELNLYDILWYQRIWTPIRASEGWRPLPDRGSPTANHMDHVHLGTN
jgi:hypothetical protein